MQAWFENSGRVGKALYQRYMCNPLFKWYGIDPEELFGRIWNIWDLINGAWLLNPSAVASRPVRAPRLSDERLWVPDQDGHWIRENTYTSYNSIFPEFARKLQKFARSGS